MTPEQLEELLSFMEAHPDLANGRLRDTEGRRKAQLSWKFITARLNDIGPPKTLRRWQKSWADKKYTAKKALSECKKSTASVSGSEPLPIGSLLSETEIKILALIGSHSNDPPSGADSSEAAEHSGPSALNKPATTPSRSRSRSPVETLPPRPEPPTKPPTQGQESIDTDHHDEPRALSPTTRLLHLEEQRVRNEQAELVELRRICDAMEQIPGEMRMIREALEVLLDVGRELAINFFESNVKC